MDKSGQFFLLSAIILSVIVIGLSGIKNSVNSPEIPSDFYDYGKQMQQETQAVLDYGLYTQTNNLEDFVQKEINYIVNNIPTINILACYTNPGDNSELICQNNGTEQLNVLYGTSQATLGGSKNGVCSGTCKITITISGLTNITITTAETNPKTYVFNLKNYSVQKNQFHFLVKTKTDSGEYVGIYN